jgi:hypothetical protein
MIMGLLQSAQPAQAVAAAPAPIATPASASAPAPKFVRYGLDRAELGMSMADWRALSPDNAQAPCAASSGDPCVTVCEPAPGTGDVSERNRKAVFVNGVLVGLAFSTSIDSFDGVMARLDKTFGKPAQVVRDTIQLSDGLVLPRVRMTWTNGLATIRLTDPQPPGGLLNVRATLNSDESRLPADQG